MQIHNLARDSLAGLPMFGLQDCDFEDLRQEAALGILRALPRVDVDRTPAEKQAFLRRAGRNAAISYLRWRSCRAREVPTTDEPVGVAGVPVCDEARTILHVVEVARDTMTPGERARLDEAIGLDPEVRISPSSRARLAFNARRKLRQTAEAANCAEILTGGVLRSLFAR